MKHLFLKSLAALAVMALPDVAVASSQQGVFRNQAAPLSRMRKAHHINRWSAPAVNADSRKVAPYTSTPAADNFEYIEGPDGTEWFATCTYDVKTVELEGGYATEDLISGYTFTIYDNKFKEIGSIHDVIEFEEGEVRCVQASLDISVTKKFFNYDDKYELMVSLWMNAENYSVNTRTKVYSIGGVKKDNCDVPVMVVPGYPVDAINIATKSWEEDFYITFLTEKNPVSTDGYASYIDYLADYKQVLTTYTKAGLGGGTSVIFEKEIPMVKLPGDQMSCPMMFSKNVDGRFTLVYQQYEKSFFIDPSGMGGNEDITPDNNLVVDIYQIDDSYPKKMEPVCSTKIATPPSGKEGALYSFYGIGNLRYDKDVDFHNYSGDGSPCFVVSVDDYVIYDDDNYNSSYYVYDASGARIKTLAEDTYSYVLMTDIPGYEPQAMFIHTGDDWTFEFVDLYSAESLSRIDQMFRGNGLSTSADRVPVKGGYNYVIATSNGMADDEEAGTLFAPVCWFDMSGEFIRIDKIPVGEGVEVARFYITSQALSPYVYNTDPEVEYMLLVKRHYGSGEALREEFLVATADKGAIHTFLPDEEKGAISTVFLIPDNNTQLIIAYQKDGKINSDAYSLPFTKFAGGTGTESDPYLIATPGDFMQIKSAPSAHFKLVADIDCGAVSVPTVEEFSGVLDGDGHTVADINLYCPGNVNLFKYCTDATIRNIDFFDCSVNLSGEGEASFLAGTSLSSSFENIHMRRFSASGSSFHGSFATISSCAWTKSRFAGCEVTGASINLPNANNVGGIAGDIRTGTSIDACVFSGILDAGNTIGGIVASTTTGDETITSCHVDADIKGQHTIGGIVGFLDRSKVKQCYVEGTIEATAPSQWTKALAVGAIAGELEGDWQGNADVPIVQNLIGVTSIKVPELDLVEEYPHQLATVHRVVGKTSYNAKIEKDEFTDPNLPDVVYETGVINNLVVSDLPVFDADFNEQTIEGQTVAPEEVSVEMLQSQLGFAYGNSIDAPWNIQSWYAHDPSLWYESSIIIPAKSLSAVEGELFNIEIAVLSRTPVSVDELLGDFMCEYDESLMEMTGDMTFEDNLMSIEFNALKAGTAQFSTSMLGGNAACTVEIVKKESVGVDVVDGSNSSLIYSGGTVEAAGCVIDIYAVSGQLVMSGSDKVVVSSLPGGVYVAVATDADGKTSSLKLMK